MNNMRHFRICHAVVVLFCALIAQVVAFTEPSRCQACTAVAAELKSRLAKEKPRNHLDMRHRLDSEGKRYGKTIDYMVSELRLVELLDGMCDSMNGYELAGTPLQSSNETTWQWFKPKKGQESKVTLQRLDKQQLKRQQRQLQNYCAQLIDKFEDDISTALQQGSNAAELEDLLCTKLSSDCQQITPVDLAYTEL